MCIRDRWMEEHDVFFDGAAEARTKASKKGTAQAWSIDSLDADKQRANWTTIEGIASIMKKYPEIDCEVHGSTGPAQRAPPVLAEHHQLDPIADVQQIMDLLAKDRANACLEALIARGVPRANLYATWKGRSEALKVDFIPQVKKSSKFYAAPLKPRLRLCLLYTSPSPRDGLLSRMPSSA